jgi:hypothetical protein
MKTFISAVALLFATSANAEYISGKELLDLLTNSDQGLKGIGQGYVIGVADISLNVLWCPTNLKISGADLVRMVEKSLPKLPDLASHSADTFMIALLSQFAPCPVKQNSEAKPNHRPAANYY